MWTRIHCLYVCVGSMSGLVLNEKLFYVRIRVIVTTMWRAGHGNLKLSNVHSWNLKRHITELSYLGRNTYLTPKLIFWKYLLTSASQIFRLLITQIWVNCFFFHIPLVNYSCLFLSSLMYLHRVAYFGQCGFRNVNIVIEYGNMQEQYIQKMFITGDKFPLSCLSPLLTLTYFL